MNLIYLSSSTLFSKSANSLHVMKMANSFSKELDKVTLFVRDIQGESSPYKYYDVENKFDIVNLKVNKFNKIAPIIYTIKVLYNLFKNKHEDSNYFFGRDILSLSLLSLIRKNVSIEIHDIPKTSLKKQLLKFLITKNKFNKVIVISTALKKDWETYIGHKLPNMIVAHDGADLQNFSANEDKKEIGYIGSVNQGRGIELIIELAKKHGNLNFNIVGGTEMDLKNKLNLTFIPENVICHGYLDQDRVKDLIKNFYIVLAPYQEKVGVAKKGVDTARWMSPIKVFEYMSFGKAIIISNLPVLKEVINDGQNAIMVKPNSLHEWSDCLVTLLEDSILHMNLKTNAYSTLKNYYTWDQRAKKIIEEVQK